MKPTFTIRLATVADQQIVIDLIDDAAKWLRTKDTDQWRSPWPDEKGRNSRILHGLQHDETWIVWDGGFPAATMTVCQRANPAVWPPAAHPDEPSVYIHRLVVHRSYAGLRLGRLMIDWATRRELGRREVRWVRIDVWKRNTALHRYYERQGFVRWGDCPDEDYPSGALFQKPAEQARRTDTSGLLEASSTRRHNNSRNDTAARF